ncbi:MAG TPA: ATP-binding protein [Longimicrobiales bacterium]|nr:ATP-binding protein [Longimicrobiales bacterium]
MPNLPTLHRELIGAGAIVLAGMLVVAVIGIILVVPWLDPLMAVAYVIALLAADIALFSWLGAMLLRRRLVTPLNELVDGVEQISSGALHTELPDAETQELARLTAAVEQMAERLLTDQQALTDNIRSLDETNRLLTEARDAMVRAEKMASVGRLGAGIAHEVGNPLGAIMGYLGLLARHEEGQRLELIRSAEKEARRIDRIVRGLLDYARPRDAVTSAVDVADVLVETTELVRTQGHFNRIELRAELPDPGEYLVRGDPYQLQQVLVNLLVNAADALESRDDGVVSIEVLRRVGDPEPPPLLARRRDDPEGVDYTHRRRLNRLVQWPEGDPESETGEVVEIVVADNGPGLPQDLVDQVFEPFVTTKEVGKGTGLGLAICARLVQGMGGAIRAANAPDGGARFRVILPALAPQVAANR